MKFKEIIELIEDKGYEILDFNIYENTNILDMDFLGHDFIEMDNSVLYVSNDQSMIMNEEANNLLTTYKLDKNNKINFIEIRSEDFSNVYHLLRQNLTRPMESQIRYYDLVREIVESRDIKLSINKISEHTGNNIAIIDLSGKILVHSEKFDLKDQIWINSIINGYMPVDFMAHIDSLRDQILINKDTKAFSNRCTKTDTEYLGSKLYLKREHVGYIFMFNNENIFSKDSALILPLISELASFLLFEDHGLSGNNQKLQENLLIDLLTGIDERHAKARITTLDMKFPNKMIVLVISASYFMEPKFLKEKIYNRILEIIPENISFIYDEDIVIIIKASALEDVDKDLYKKIYEEFRMYSLRIGISNEFTDPIDFPIFYDQSKTAIIESRKLKEKDTIVFYKDYSFIHLLSEYNGDIGLDKFCHPYLEKVLKHDKEYGTELYETLDIYVNTGFNRKETSDKLFIHRNTLDYRRDQINRIIGTEIEKEDILFNLLYSFKIYSYLEGDYR